MSDEEFASLPDNYRAAVSSQAYSASFPLDLRAAPYLPADLFEPGGGWIILGRKGGPIAMSHTANHPFLGRSVFLVLLRVPGGQAATVDFIARLNLAAVPDLPAGLEVALVRRMMLLDDRGDLEITPLVEAVQVRYFPGAAPQRYYSFSLNRGALFGDVRGGLDALEDDYLLFFSHGGDPSDSGISAKGSVPQICTSCHQDDGAGVYGVRSILSYSRARFALPGDERPALVETTAEREAQAVAAWKTQDDSWLSLQSLLMPAPP